MRRRLSILRPLVFALRPWRRHGLVLAVLGAVYILIGLSYVLTDLSPMRQSSLRVALALMSLEGWGVVWIIAGLLAILSSRWPPASETWGYTLMSGLAALWGSFYATAIGLGASVQAVTGALVWFMVAFLWWAISGLKNPDGW